MHLSHIVSLLIYIMPALFDSEVLNQPVINVNWISYIRQAGADASSAANAGRQLTVDFLRHVFCLSIQPMPESILTFLPEFMVACDFCKAV